MEENHFIRAKEVAKILDCSESRAYKIIKQLKDELKEQGYIVLAGRVPRNYFMKRICL
jgi:prophage antirepressor-like protein